jgi:hypothetical protein
MASEPDRVAGLSARRVGSLTGVRPQTRETWVRRGLLRAAAAYGELDVIEQSVVKALLSTLPKSHVDLVWHELRPQLRRLGHQAAILVWDEHARAVSVTTNAEELREAVVHGRPVYAMPLGELIIEARRVYRAELEASRRTAAARKQVERSGVRTGATPPSRGAPQPRS